MTMMRQVLRVMEDGQPRTATELASVTGLEIEVVRNIIKQLTRQGQAESSKKEVEYKLSPKGEEKAAKEAARTPEELEDLREKAQYKRVWREAKVDRPRRVANSAFNWR